MVKWRPRTGRSAQHVAQVRAELQRNPRGSSRRNNVPQIFRVSFNRITWQDLQMHLYRIRWRFALRPGDHGRRLAFCQWLTQRPERFLRQIIISDEATFSLNGSVNTWNTRRYSARRNPPRNFTFDRPNNRQSVTVWVALDGSNQIIGPYFLRGNVNGQTYLNMIKDQVLSELQRR